MANNNLNVIEVMAPPFPNQLHQVVGRIQEGGDPHPHGYPLGSDFENFDTAFIPVWRHEPAHPPQQPAVVKIECEISEELSAAVFGNDMLRGIILEHAIYPKGEVSRQDLKNLRLVGRNWLQTAMDSMKKFREPVFTLTLGKKGPELLDQFVLAMTSPTRLPADCIPPFCVKLMPKFFREENHDSLSHCLVSCGTSLTDFEIKFPSTCSMTLVFPSFYFPMLHRLTVQFSRQRLDDPSAVKLDQNALICPLQTILHGANESTNLFFKFATSEALIPFGLKYLVLPETVTSLDLDCPLKDGDLQLLLRNNPLNLKSLRLFAGSTLLSGETIFQILEKYCTSLRFLGLYGREDYHHGRVSVFRFPVMEKLKTLEVCSTCWELEDGLNHLESQLPELNDLKIMNTNGRMFTKWTSTSRFVEVKHLAVSLVAVPDCVQAQTPMSLTMEKMSLLALSFTNVVNLDITVRGRFDYGFRYVFLEMRSLEKLAITVSWRGRFLPNFWDSVFIGMQPERMTAFRKSPSYLQTEDLQDDANFPSIRKLKSLTMLSLVDKMPSEVVGHRSLISYLSFKFAFLKMPKLTKLLLHGRFLASAKMTQRWKQEKGTDIIRV